MLAALLLQHLLLGLVVRAEGAWVQHTRQGRAQQRILLARALLQLAHLRCCCHRLPGLEGVSAGMISVISMLLLLLLGMSCSRRSWCCHGLSWLLLPVLPAAAGSSVQDGMPKPMAPVKEALVLNVLVLDCCCVLLGFLPVGALLQHHMP